MARRLTRTLAIVAIVSWIAGVWRAAGIVRANTGHGPDALFLWALIPLGAAAGVLLLSWRRSLVAVWLLAGVCCSFVLIAAWGLGPFFAWTALLLLLAACMQTAAVGAGWRALLIPVWLVTAFTGTCALFVVIHQILMIGSNGRIIEAPLLIRGSWAFVGLVAFLAIERAIERAAFDSVTRQKP
jgi:hypothetical protein